MALDNVELAPSQNQLWLKEILPATIRYIGQASGDPIGERFVEATVAKIEALMKSNPRLQELFAVTSDFRARYAVGRIVDELLGLESQDGDNIEKFDKDVQEIRGKLRILFKEIVSDTAIHVTEESKRGKYAIRGPIDVEIQKQHASWVETLKNKLEANEVENGQNICDQVHALRADGIEAQRNFLKEYITDQTELDNLMSTYPIFANVGNAAPYLKPTEVLQKALGKKLIKQECGLDNEEVINQLRLRLGEAGFNNVNCTKILEILEEFRDKLGYGEATLNLDEIAGYSAVSGIPELANKVLDEMIIKRNLISKDERDINRVVLGNGSSELIRMIYKILVSEGDEVCYAYKSIYPLYAFEDGRHKVRERTFERETNNAINENTRLVVICSPDNPSGRSMSKEYMDQLIEAIRTSNNKQLVVVFDEAYRDMKLKKDNTNFDPALYLHEQMPEQVFITLNSISKRNALCGLRAGYGVVSGPKENIKELIAELSRERASSLCSNTVAQLTLATVLENNDLVDTSDLQNRSQALINGLRKNGIAIQEESEPEGGLYLWLNIQALKEELGFVSDEQGTSSEKFARAIVDEAHVSVVPGSGFGSDPDNDNCIRLITFLPEDTNREIAKRFGDWIKRKRKDKS
ncbi:MAG: pyridoxal phosphate-dependent aminotransferase, partial [Candidatus Woesearchaeota archaeon]